MFHGQSKFSIISTTVSSPKGLTLAAALAAVSAFAQPNPPAAPYMACKQEPTGAAMTDTVGGGVDQCGYISLFDGATDKGWWQSCQTGHGGPSKWKIVPEEKAIYSTQDGTKGSLLMSNKKFTNYEMVWEYWPDYGNDGGIFNRTPANGVCFQTVLDYIGGAAIGGTWAEGGFQPPRDYRPFSFANGEQNITIPGNGNGEPSNWTTMTQKMKAAGQQFDCPASGCTQADWQRLWDFNGWNQIRLQFYGGVAGNNRVRMKFWFRKSGATSSAWVPVSYDTTLMKTIDPGYIGLQVHGGGRFGGARGTWYRNIKWTPLTDMGAYVYPAAANPGCVVGVEESKPTGYVQKVIFTMDGSSMVGQMDLDHEITVKNINGVTVQTFKGKAGNVNYALNKKAVGWLALDIKTSQGTRHQKLIRDAK